MGTCPRCRSCVAVMTAVRPALPDSPCLLSPLMRSHGLRVALARVARARGGDDWPENGCGRLLLRPGANSVVSPDLPATSHPVPLTNVLREDVPAPTLDVDEPSGRSPTRRPLRTPCSRAILGGLHHEQHHASILGPPHQEQCRRSGGGAAARAFLLRGFTQAHSGLYRRRRRRGAFLQCRRRAP